MRIDRLDKTVFAVAAVLALGFAFFLLRGDQVGAQIIRSTPAANAQNVPARSPIRLTFSEPMVTATLEGKIRLQPEIPGMLRWSRRNGIVCAFGGIAAGYGLPAHH